MHARLFLDPAPPGQHLRACKPLLLNFNITYRLTIYWLCSPVVKCSLHARGVVGSNLQASSNNLVLD